MRRKIALSLLVVFLCAASGAVTAVLYIRRTTAELAGVIELHRVEELRRHLIIAVQTAQSDLYTVHTTLGQRVDVIAENVSRLDEAAAKCAGCHHSAEVAPRLERVRTLIGEYEEALSDYITASANRERIGRLQADAAALGGELLRTTEEMSLEATRALEMRTEAAMHRMDGARSVLFAVLAVTLLLAVAVALRLMRSVTRPIDTLVEATRALAAGRLGTTIPAGDRTEFGELAGHFNAMSGALRDGYAELQAQIQERDQAEQALRRSEERYALAARGANDGLWDWDLDAGRIHLSARWKSMLGLGEDAVGDTPKGWLDLVHHEDRARLEADLAAHVEGKAPHVETEYRIRHADGSFLWVVCRGVAVRDGGGRAYRIAGSQTDITARKHAEEQLLYDAFHDALTGLANRSLFIDRLEQVIRASRRRRDESYAVLFFDLDRFKVINDSLGHVIGDKLLAAVGQRIARCLRPDDTVARLGGDEFAILLTDVRGLGDALLVVDRVQSELAKSFEIEGHEIFANASIGIAARSERYERPEQVLRDADVAMYQAKSKGRSCYEIFDAQMHGGVVERLALESDLRRAVEHGDEFLLHYQPIVDLRNSRVIGFEALVRWREPGRGLVAPSEFIPLAEESGMIVPIGEWTIRTACAQLRAWREGRATLADANMSINMSARQFRQPDLVERLSRLLGEAGVEPSNVALELTESAIMDDVTATATKLTRLRDMGVQIHVDDFGTGYSSLSYLHRFPINAVKIDRSFVRGLSEGGGSDALIRAIVSIAESLKFEVIAEGIETPEQLARLRELRCRYGQGYHFARPMPPEDLTASAWGAGPRAGQVVPLRSA